MAERKSLSKRTRFEIFKRDGFRCHYCGTTAGLAPLRVDHVVPVAKGGTDDPANLITACLDCNAGKAAVPLEEQKFRAEAITEAHREHAEQIAEWLAIQRDVSGAKTQAVDHVIEEWERRVGPAARSLRPRAWKMLEEFGLPRVIEAFDIVAAKDLLHAEEQVKYLHGVLRRWREERAVEVQEPPKASSVAHPFLQPAIDAGRAAAVEARSDPERFRTKDERRAHVIRAVYTAAGVPPEDVQDEVDRALGGETFFWDLGIMVEFHDEGDLTKGIVTQDEFLVPTDAALIRLQWEIGEVARRRSEAARDGRLFDAQVALDRLESINSHITRWLVAFRTAERTR